MSLSNDSTAAKTAQQILIHYARCKQYLQDALVVFHFHSYLISQHWRAAKIAFCSWYYKQDEKQDVPDLVNWKLFSILAFELHTEQYKNHIDLHPYMKLILKHVGTQYSDQDICTMLLKMCGKMNVPLSTITFKLITCSLRGVWEYSLRFDSSGTVQRTLIDF